MIGSASLDEVHRDMLASLIAGHPVTDVAFDCIYPEHVRQLSKQFWTPVEIARRAARLFVEHGARRVLDVGAGVGKFCIISVLTADLDLTGIELQEGLVTIANGILRAYSIPRVQIRHASLDELSLDAYDGFYFFNPFAAGTVSTQGIGRTTRSTPEHAERDIVRIEKYLVRARPGTCMVTFHGFGDAVPPGWLHLADETRGTAFLKLWIKDATKI